VRVPRGRRAVGGERETGIGRRLALGQAHDDLAEERSELGAVAGARRGDDEGALPVEDEVLVDGRGVKAGGLRQLVAVIRLIEAGKVAGGEGEDAVAVGRVDGEVAGRRGDRLSRVVLADLDRAGDAAVTAAEESVETGLFVLADEARPRVRRGRRALGQVQDLLLGDGQRRQAHQPAREGLEPRADRDDGHRRGELLLARADYRAGRGRLDARRRRPEADVRAVGRGGAEHGGHRAVGVERARLWVEQDGTEAVEAESGPALGRLTRRNELGFDVAGAEHLIEAFRVADRAAVQAARRGEDCLAGFLFQPSPQVPGAPGHLDVEPVGVHPAEDPGAAVRAAVRVAGLESLQDGDGHAAPGRHPGGRAAGEAGPDDDQIGMGQLSPCVSR
jgi:hypothetical protein